MTPDDFRRLALGLPGTAEGAHMGSPDFRVGGRIFATLAAADQGYGNLMLTPEVQATLVATHPEVFLPIAGGWGRMGMTHVRLATVSEALLTEVLRIAWDLRMAKNRPKPRKKPG